MTQLTLRSTNPQLDLEIRRLARREGLSLNKAALRLLLRGAGLDAGSGNDHRIGAGLDKFIGTWTAREARAFERSQKTLEKIDPELWR